MSRNAIIIGGGIAGTAMALFLKRAGITSAIYEAYPKRDDIGGGLQLAPNGMNVLASLGLADKVIEHGTIATEMRFLNQKGKILGKINRGLTEKYAQPAVNISRSALHKVLVEEVERKGIVIHYNKKLVNITDGSGKQAAAEFADGSTAEGDIVIGADGIRSKTREIILPDAPKPDFTGMQWIAGFVPQTEVPLIDEEDHKLYMIFGMKGFFGYGNFSRKDAIIGWWYNIVKEQELTKEELGEVANQEVRNELLEICKGWNGPVEELIKKTPKLIRGNVHDIQSLPSWHNNRRAVLIGDAAHAVSPNSGQGASLALEDASYLAKLLFEESDSLENIFELFVQERRPRVEKIIAEGRRTGDNKKEMTPVSAWIRDRMLSIIFPLFVDKGNRWKYEYKVDWKS
ncbi:FAD-dependent oxidoreductase [Alkalihalobacterium sp. APHAB7]|uniref:FAD-dependent oxidoreductase n=1 Tax=Alkalihalobacterium sp. APHAB7 TaxID=3402081 RepID=UPI003AAE1BD3